MLQASSRLGSAAFRQPLAAFSRAPVPSRRPLPGKNAAGDQSCRRASVVAGAGKALKVNGEQLEAEIANRDCHLIVDFYATWCGPCVLLAQELEKAAEQLGDEVKILKLDVDENPQLSSSLKIEGLPTIVFVPKAGDKPALRTEGLYPADQLVQIVREL